MVGSARPAGSGKVDLTKWFDSLDLGVDAIEDWAAFEAGCGDSEGRGGYKMSRATWERVGVTLGGAEPD